MRVCKDNLVLIKPRRFFKKINVIRNEQKSDYY